MMRIVQRELDQGPGRKVLRAEWSPCRHGTRLMAVSSGNTALAIIYSRFLISTAQVASLFDGLLSTDGLLSST